MRSRARRRMPNAGQNLDSFLDVLTNVVGVLIFVSIFASLSATGGAQKTRVTIQTPLSSPTNKEALWFEIENKKVSYLNVRQVRAKELELSGNLPNCNKPTTAIDPVSISNYQSCLMSVLGRQSNFRVDTENYRVTTVDEGVSLLFEPNAPNIGETTPQLNAENSAYKQVLSKFDPQKDYLAFIVRPDSFEAFRDARKQAWAAGYEVGWEPLEENAPIKIRTIIGSELPGGRSIGVQ